MKLISASLVDAFDRQAHSYIAGGAQHAVAGGKPLYHSMESQDVAHHALHRLC